MSNVYYGNKETRATIEHETAPRRFLVDAMVLTCDGTHRVRLLYPINFI
jgi:hypothetical protein